MRDVLTKVGHGLTSVVECNIPPEKSITIRPGAIVTISKNAGVQSRSSLWKGFLHGESWYVTTLGSRDKKHAWSTIAPLDFSEVEVVGISRHSGIVLKNSAFLAHTADVRHESHVQGGYWNALHGTGLVLQKFVGVGLLAFSCLGGSLKLDVKPQDAVFVDNSNFVGFTENLQGGVSVENIQHLDPTAGYARTKIAGAFSDEGYVVRFENKSNRVGRVYFSAREPQISHARPTTPSQDLPTQATQHAGWGIAESLARAALRADAPRDV